LKLKENNVERASISLIGAFLMLVKKYEVNRILGRSPARVCSWHSKSNERHGGMLCLILIHKNRKDMEL